MQLELGSTSNLRSPVNTVQLNQDLIVVGATGPKPTRFTRSSASHFITV